MRPAQRRKSTILALSLLTLSTLASVLALSASPYLFGPGKYCGVVVFDRWETCFLINGTLITYVAADVKGDLLSYKNTAVQVDASEVSSAGLRYVDPMIHKYKIIGPAPEPRWLTINGLQLVAVNDFGPSKRPEFVIEIRNAGKSSVKVDRSEIGILLFKAERPELSTSDDISVALIARTGVDQGSSMTYEKTGNRRSSWGYTVDMKTQPPAHFVVAPGRFVRIRIRFKLYPGQYQFMFAYGGGPQADEKSVASNAISFDMSVDGRAKIAD